MITLGSIVKDTLTGFKGMATGKTQWLFGCTRIAIEPTSCKDGKPIEMQWFDEQRIQVIKEGKPTPTKDATESTSGGPQRDPSR